jgi:26S proteasome regulatory subunit N1
MLETAYEIYKNQQQYYDAVRVALRMDRTDLIPELLKECEKSVMQK